MTIPRILNLPNMLKKRPFFLFGPRATGKSYLIKTQFKNAIPVIDLLDSKMFFRLQTSPHELESIVTAYDDYSMVVIDEVQKIPELLDEVHRLIEKYQIHFLLTGSSARKLKQQQANLLAGRARQAELFPLTSKEILEFDLDRYLLYGGLPLVHLSDEPEEELYAYVNTYLKEEIQNEALVRQLQSFTRFLQFSALTSGQILNFSRLSNDAGIPATTIREYYYLLEDTFLGFMLPAWTKSVKRKPISTAKFYYFDLGVKNILTKTRYLEPHSDLYSQAFEHFIALELKAYISYQRKHVELNYWQAKNGQEVDFIIDDRIAIEVKSAQSISDKHLKGLKVLQEEHICEDYYVVSKDTINRNTEEGIQVIYWQDFLDKLWSDTIF